MKGYLTAFDGTTLIDHSTKRALNMCSSGNTTNVRVHVLPNGTKVAFDGTGDSPTTPGTLVQEIRISTGGQAFFDTLEGKLGNYGTLTFTNLSAVAKTCAAILANVEDVSPRRISTRAKMNIRLTFELLGDWA